MSAKVYSSNRKEIIIIKHGTVCKKIMQQITINKTDMLNPGSHKNNRLLVYIF